MAAMATATKEELYDFLAWCWAAHFVHPELDDWHYCVACDEYYRCMATHMQYHCKGPLYFDQWHASLSDRDADALYVRMVVRYPEQWAAEQHRLRAAREQEELHDAVQAARMGAQRQPVFEDFTSPLLAVGAARAYG